ncbi:MAG: tetratricopeptide repeat protein, partial [Persicimonas sp.]
MPQPISQGWQQLTQGNLVAAEQIFEQYGGSREALDGLSRVALYQGDVRRAESLARESLSQQETPSVQMLMGEILSAQGKRQQAEHVLSRATSDMRTDAY